jgi:cytoskeletal protein RodZ
MICCLGKCPNDTTEAISIGDVIRPHRSIFVLRHAAILSIVMAMIAFCQSPGAFAAEEPNPFFPSTTKHRTTKTVSSASKTISAQPRTSSVPKLSVTASATAKKGTVTSSPATSTTASTPAIGAAKTAPVPSSPATTTQGKTLGTLSLTQTKAAQTSKKRHRSTLSSLSNEAIVVAALAGLLVLLCLAWALARWLVYEPRWLLSTRHSLEEANFRVSASLSELADWMRLGR